MRMNHRAHAEFVARDRRDLPDVVDHRRPAFVRQPRRAIAVAGRVVAFVVAPVHHDEVRRRMRWPSCVGSFGSRVISAQISRVWRNRFGRFSGDTRSSKIVPAVMLRRCRSLGAHHVEFERDVAVRPGARCPSSRPRRLVAPAATAAGAGSSRRRHPSSTVRNPSSSSCRSVRQVGGCGSAAIERRAFGHRDRLDRPLFAHARSVGRDRRRVSQADGPVSACARTPSMNACSSTSYDAMKRSFQSVDLDRLPRRTRRPAGSGSFAMPCSPTTRTGCRSRTGSSRRSRRRCARRSRFPAARSADRRDARRMARLPRIDDLRAHVVLAEQPAQRRAVDQRVGDRHVGRSARRPTGCGARNAASAVRRSRRRSRASARDNLVVRPHEADLHEPLAVRDFRFDDPHAAFGRHGERLLAEHRLAVRDRVEHERFMRRPHDVTSTARTSAAATTSWPSP